jgi:superoxide dismutase, Fe-Mn family
MKRRDFLANTLATTLTLPLSISALADFKSESISSESLSAIPTSIEPITLADDKFTLAPLPYSYNALEPSIDAMTMEIHYSKHHAGYVKNLNSALDGIQASTDAIQLVKNLDAIPEAKRNAVRNNGGGHLNHTMFWESMKSPSSNVGNEPTGILKVDIEKKFGSLAQFKETFNSMALSRFGSGWMWLSFGNGALQLHSTANQDNPLMGERYSGVQTATPLLGLDVWEHAYYLKYQNKRADYVKAWWDVVNWAVVSERYDKAKQ